MSEPTMQQLAAAFRKVDRAVSAYQVLAGWIEDEKTQFPVLEVSAKSPMTGEPVKLAFDLQPVLGQYEIEQRRDLFRSLLNKQAEDYRLCLDEIATIAMSLSEQATKAAKQNASASTLPTGTG